MTRSVLFPTLLVFAATFFASSALMAAPKQSSAADPQVQIDGICGTVAVNLWNHADSCFHAGDYPRAIATDRIITAAEPTFMEAYATGGWLLESDGKLAEAEAYYKEGVDNNPEHSYAYYQLGSFYFFTKHDYSMAVKTFESDVKTSDAEANDWKMLAHSYEKNRQIDQAVSAWKVIKKRFPTTPAVDYNLNKDLKLQAAEQGQASPAANNAP
jgi:tetratricopeptide (TPR) repeat protein